MDLTTLIIGIVVLVFSAILHEVMHGVVADRLGDPTARLMGRLTLNPLPHIDPFMSIIIPALLIISRSPIVFGAAKPVPVNPLNLREGKKDLALVALAGPLTNIVIAIIAAFVLRFVGQNDLLTTIVSLIVLYNLILGILNLIPIPPLDGSKILILFMPNTWARTYLSIERYGIIILLILLLFPLPFFNINGIINQLLNSALKLLGVA